ncbi:uncharacterized protein SCHCODRAFT_02569293 [Schizophyllum commune H4-8]|uniref:uncharacterized protein n=1 Tax=Schizophyllum commune (strain H4-8 / FGSC 9210) TaxID=578458 RepID=UPI00215EAA33|nr:uncharacterized protein SCHCODRAFT_02569293 [Schizophyllum commune H4-8]KAI5896570.1 hypothetical protein SCHCODRAFT_02569293 [Schizophyllum commune H4-8]
MSPQGSPRPSARARYLSRQDIIIERRHSHDSTGLGHYARRRLSIATALYLTPASVSYADINDMPRDILSEIFVHTLPECVTDTMVDFRSQSLIISQVCRYWRDVAIKLPSLWRLISLFGCPDAHHHRSLELARIFVDRSRGTELRFEYCDIEAIYLRDRGRGIANVTFAPRGGLVNTPANERCPCVLDFMISHIAVTRTLELTVGHASCQRLASLPPAAASMLRGISVSFLEGGNAPHTLARLYGTAPQLAHFARTTSVPALALLPPGPTDVPWRQLVTAHISDSSIPYSQFLEIVATAPLLATLRAQLCLDSFHATHPPSPPHPRIIQSRLEELDIFSLAPLDVIFSSLQLPSLRRLTLRSVGRRIHSPPVGAWPCDDLQTLSHFIEGITPGLMVLRLLPSNDISQGDLITLLRKAQMATLTELELLRGPVASDALFTQLDPEYGPPLLPRVQRLTLAECNTTDGAIGNMLASRCRLGYPLRMLRIRTHLDEMDRYHKDKRMFQSLEEQYGMRVDYPGSRAWLEALKATSAARRKGRL